MDFELDADQLAILEAVEGLLERHAGVERATLLGKERSYDLELEGALNEAGFRDIAGGEDTGLLEAALVVEAIARAGGVMAAGAGILVAPLLGVTLEGPVAMVQAGSGGPVRYAAHAQTLLVADESEARVVVVPDGAISELKSNFGFPMGRVPSELTTSGGESLGPGSGARLRDLWRLSLAVEAVGTMRAALDVTVDYVKQRRQFGRHIGSFQAVGHRLAECAIEVEASRWLAFEAAHHDAPREATAVAASYALDAADRVFAETHQLSGAIGFTHEHPLHVFSMRLPALRLEMGGASSHARAVAAARWPDS